MITSVEFILSAGVASIGVYWGRGLTSLLLPTHVGTYGSNHQIHLKQ
jgi:hypothetical protein